MHTYAYNAYNATQNTLELLSLSSLVLSPVVWCINMDSGSVSPMATTEQRRCELSQL